MRREIELVFFAGARERLDQPGQRNRPERLRSAIRVRIETSRFAAISFEARSIASITASRRARSVSRTSRLSRTRLGMLFTAPGKHVAHSHRRHGISGSARARRILDRQNQLRGGAQRIAPVGHQDAAGVASRSLRS